MNQVLQRFAPGRDNLSDESAQGVARQDLNGVSGGLR